LKQSAATEAKNKFGQLIEMAMSEPVAIEKKGRPVAVLISFAEYQRLIEIEDRQWGERAKEVLKKGFMTQDETTKWLTGKLGAEASGK